MTIAVRPVDKVCHRARRVERNSGVLRMILSAAKVTFLNMAGRRNLALTGAHGARGHTGHRDRAARNRSIRRTILQAI